MALKVWLPLNGNPYMRNLGINSNIIPESAGTHHSFSSEGKLGYALTFVGAASDYLCIPGLKLQTFSWACWFKCTGSTTATSQRILSEGRDTGSRGAEIWISQDSTTLYLQAHGVTHTTTIGIFSSYLNGNLINSSTYTANCDYAQSNDKFVIGKMAYNYTNTSNYFPFVGRINDVRLYDHCLSAKEVKEISQGLILHYKLDGFSGGAGENLLVNSSLKKRVNGFPNITTYTQTFEKKDGYDCYHIHSDTLGKTAYLSWDVKNIINNYPIGTKFVFSGWIKADNIVKGTTNYFASLYYGGSYNNNGTSTWIGEGSRIASSPTSNSAFDLSEKGWTYCYIVSTFTRNDYTSMGAMYYLRDFTGDVYFRDFKFEVGDKPTAWSPAPQDLGIETTKIPDSSGYGNDGIIINTISAEQNSPRYQIATHISSTSSKIRIDNLQTSGFGNSYTFAWWAKISSVNPMHWGFANGIRLNGMYTGRLWNTGDGSNNPLYNPGTTTQVTAPTVNTWHHWAMVGNGSKCLVYQDGQLWAEAKTYKAISGTTIYINGWDSSTSYCSDNLSISDFRIYATALSAEDILDLYHTSANIDNLGGVHGFEFIEKTPNLLNPDPREWTIETSVTCVWNEETGYFDVNTNRDTSVTSRWGVYTGVPIKPNTTYLFSAEVLDNKSYIGVAGGTSSRSLPSNIISWNGEKRYYYFFTTSSSHTHAWVYLCSKPSETTAGHFKNIYLGEVGEIASIKQSGIFENEDMVEYNENGRITKSGELAGSNFIEK